LSIAPSRDVALETQSFDEYLGTELVLDLPVEIVPTPTERIAERQCSLSILGPCPKGP
jgi:hypothetical protein